MGDVVASRTDVARLFGRAAFGATAADLDRWTGQPYQQVVSALVDVPDPATRGDQPDDVKRLVLERTDAGLPAIQKWWLERMRSTPYPLEERMTLFLHDHFATGVGPEFLPTAPLLLRQNQLLRQYSLASFRTLTERLTIDPAMLYWLSGNYSMVGQPNENYARELFELFTLGVIPQVYTETDIREAARAFTGWTVDGLGQAVFVDIYHDKEQKRVLGQTIIDQGPTEYKAVVAAALEQTVAQRYLAHKLVLNFGYQPTTTDLLIDPDPLTVAVADALGTGWNLRAAVRALLLDDSFRSPGGLSGREQLRSPIEVAVHTAKALGFSADNDQVVYALSRMGQKPFEPPNVSGWPVGRDWLSLTTVLARYDWSITAYYLATSNSGVPAAVAGALPAPLNAVIPAPLPASTDLDPWAARFGLAELSTQTRAAINGYLAGVPATSEAERQLGVQALLLTSPDWMVI